MPTPRYLTKSRFKLAVECPTKLYYSGKKGVYADAKEEDSFLELLAKGGYQVGALAKLAFPLGIEVEERAHEAAEAITADLLRREDVVLFEPAIRVGNFFVRIDILVKSGDTFELIEVKAKSYNSSDPQIEGKRGGISSGMLPYLQDVAFQTWVLQQAFPKAKIKSFLAMPDKAKLAAVDGVNQMFKITDDELVEVRVPEGVDGKRLAQALLAKVDVGKYVRQILGSQLEFPGGPADLATAARDWAEAYWHDRKIRPVIGAHCAKCQFSTDGSDGLKNGFHECWQDANGWTIKDFDGGTILDLWSFVRKDQLIAEGVLKLTDVRRHHLKDPDPELHAADGLKRNQRQWLQAAGIPKKYDRGGFFFNRKYAEADVAAWRCPYHFIDFETSAVALPFFAGMRPYEPVAFQFSHHVMEADGRIRHAGQFLCTDPGKFPNYEFVRELRKQLKDDDGSVFMWSHHESTILNAILEQLEAAKNAPADAAELKAFITELAKDGQRALVDLRVLSEKAFFHPSTNGSNSIKDVLPAVLQASELLRETYSKPVYGDSAGIPSLNFKAGFAWLDGAADPYQRLRELAEEFLPKQGGKMPEGSASVIAEGGAAAVAYARLQFGDLDAAARERVTSALLRYCELDTFAMVLIVQAWLSWLKE